jgi:DNA repair protein RecN (Recombination protein N)
MIERLRIRDLAIVAEAEIAFGAGLTVLTGETGAGKSIVLGALGLLAGARADASAVRDGADEALVEAVFRCQGLDDLDAALARHALAAEDGELIVARSVARSGRSRATVGGRLVPVSVLADLFGGRLEISSQHESQRLRRPDSHALLLDTFGGLVEARGRVAALHGELRRLCEERETLEAAAAERTRRRDFVAFQLGEIDAAGLAAGELGSLPAEHGRLAHAEELRGAAAGAATTVAGDPGLGDAAGAADLVAGAVRQLEPVADLDPRLAALADRLRAAQTDLADAARDLERYADGVEVDPERRAVVEERLAVLDRLCRKYGRSEGELRDRREALAAELEGLEGSEARERDLVEREAAARQALVTAAGELSRGRVAAAGRLARAVEETLHELAMPHARLEVALAAARSGDLPCGPAGAETVELLLSANPGEAPRALRRIASGGELSRIFLALTGALRRAEAGRVLVFDEVDSGVGGRTADRVGQALADLAAGHQVLCITHLPQVAARAATHLRVEKRVRGGRTIVEVDALGADARVEELARMAGGARITEATRRHARELLRGGGRHGPAPVRRPASPGPGA